MLNFKINIVNEDLKYKLGPIASKIAAAMLGMLFIKFADKVIAFPPQFADQLWVVIGGLIIGVLNDAQSFIGFKQFLETKKELTKEELREALENKLTEEEPDH